MSNRTRWIVWTLAAVAALLGIVFLVFRNAGTESPDGVTPEAGPSTTASPTTSPPVATSSPTPTASPAAAFREGTCRFEPPVGRQVRCGDLEVPERRDQPGGATIRLHVAIFASDNPEPRPDPILYLEGGPGGDALETVPFAFEQRFARFLENRDFIMFDQRGTGFSEPSLSCPETREVDFEILPLALPAEESADRYLDSLRECRERLQGDGVDLSAYTSAASAADIADLITVLDYEQVNLYGISYGTRLALTVLRDHPDHIRSVVLDSAYPLEADALVDFPSNGRRALDLLLAACGEDAGCSSAYPDLAGDLDRLVAELDGSPLTLPVTDIFTGDAYEAKLNGDGLVGLLFQGLYSAELIPLLPDMVGDLAAADVVTASRLLTTFLADGEFLSIGVLASVQCGEEIPFATPEEVAVAGASDPLLDRLADSSINVGEPAFEMCEIWQVDPPDPLENQPVTSDVPTLVLAGEFDPITPPAWGRLAADGLERSQLIVFPGIGHGASVSGDCPADLVVAFWDDPAAPLDTGCVGQMSGPDFLVGEVAAPAVELIPFTEQLFGVTLTGLVPEGWERLAPGTFARLSTPIDPTGLVLQAAPGVSAGLLLDLFAGQLGADAPPTEAGTRSLGARDWMLYTWELQGSPADLAIHEQGDLTVLAILISEPAEQASLRADVLLPVLESLEFG